MRFSATFQSNYLRVPGTIYVFLIPIAYFVAPDAHKAALHERIIAWVVWAMMLVAMLPQYYELREDGLLLRLRWKTRVIPYASVVELWDLPNRPIFRAEVNLGRVITNTGETHTFGVEEKDRFLKELSKHCPQVACPGNP